MSKLLVLTPQLPYPPHQGTSLRNFHIIEGLAERHQITLLSFLQDQDWGEQPPHTPLSALCQQVVTVPAPQSRSTATRLWQMMLTRKADMTLRLQSQRFSITLRRLLGENSFDVVQIEGIEMAWTIETIRQVCPKQKLVYDAHNAEAVLQVRASRADLEDRGRWLAAAYSWVQSGRLRRFETWIGEQVNWITAVSQIDKENLARQLLKKPVPITVIPNCIDVAQYAVESISEQGQADTEGFDIVFLGKMDYRPNVDAVLWFANKVWPQIAAGRPGTTWAIVGQKPHARLDYLREVPGITVTGWVDRVQPYLAGARVFIMPFRIGSGTRLKLIEALAAGKAVVSTSLGVEGYPVHDGQELLLADTANEMAFEILRLLQDSELRAQLGKRGQEFSWQYDWRKVIPIFDEVYDALAT
jgi:glycosyltransferase involved in cell wall biosynthesis